MKRIIFLLLIVLICVYLTACSGTKKIEASGNIEITEVDIASRVTGRIVKLFVDKGAHVKKDQLLAQIDDKLVSAQYEDAKAFYDEASVNYKRSVNLLKTSSISKQSMDQAESLYFQSKARLTQAEIMKDEANVIAPWDGVIIDRYVEEGELVSSLIPLFTIGDLNIAKLDIYLSLKEMERIKLNDPAIVQIDAYPGKEFKGKVTYISDEAEFTPKNIQTKDERVKEVFKVEIQLQNQEGIFKPGMPADAVIMK